MRLLLVTHAILWWLLADPQLPDNVRSGTEEATAVFVSAVSAMEIATKYRIGKLEEAEGIAGRLNDKVSHYGFEPLAVTLAHGDRAGLLERWHKDPLDRLLVAQALAEELTIVSRDEVFDLYGVRRLW